MNAVDHAEKLIKKGGCVHLIGIGGIGMAGVAWLLHMRGLNVSGCDLQRNRQTQWLSRHGIFIIAKHDPNHITDGAGWVVRSTAVSESHPEISRAVESGIPVLRRGEVLAALMRSRVCIAVSGTHGKTTTTAMIAQVLDCGFCIGGEIHSSGAVARDDALMVIEADESDGTVASYLPDYSIITNIEYDHMEHHASKEAFSACFEQLISNTKKEVLFCANDCIAEKLCSGHPKCNPFFYPFPKMLLPVPGKHNQWNASAAAAVCRHWKTEPEIIKALKYFKPVYRRFETVIKQDGIRIILDYAHHPTEIAALIQTAQELQSKRLLGVFQPHRYTRTLALKSIFPSAFRGLEKLWIVPVYAASEPLLDGGTASDLAACFPMFWRHRLYIETSAETAWEHVREELKEGDILLIIGAGDIDKMVEQAKRWFKERFG